MDLYNFRTLFAAIEKGNHNPMVQVCQTTGFNVDFKIFCPIMANLTCQRKKEKLFKYFNCNKVKIGPLDVAIIFNDAVAVDILMFYKPDLRHKIGRRVSNLSKDIDEEVCSPIHLAVILHHNTILKKLIQGCDVAVLSSEDHELRSPLDLAFLFDNPDAASLLIAAGSSFATFPDTNISRLNLSRFMDNDCNKQKPEVILQMVEVGYSHGPDIVASFILNMDLDETGVQDHFEQLVKSVPFDVNRKYGDTKESYLHLAAYQHCLWLVRYLIGFGFDPNQLNLLNENCLHSAARACYFGSDGPAVVETLLKIGTSSSAVDVRGRTALEVAILYCNHSLICPLLNGHVNRYPTSDGYNLLHLYCNEGNVNQNALTRLVQTFDPNAVTKKGFTALMLLINRIDDDHVQIQWVLDLLQLTTNIHARNVNGDTILTIALIRSLNLLVNALSQSLKDFEWKKLTNIPDRAGITPLMYAMLNPSVNPEIFHLLLNSGADLNAVDIYGRNILYLFLAKNERKSFGIITEIPDGFGFFEWQLEIRIPNSGRIKQPCDTYKMHDVERKITQNPTMNVNYDNDGKFICPLAIAMHFPWAHKVVKDLIANHANVSKVCLDEMPISNTVLKNCLELQNVGYNRFQNYLKRYEEHLQQISFYHSNKNSLLKNVRLLSRNSKIVQPLSKMCANIVRVTYSRSRLQSCHTLTMYGKRLTPEILKYIFVNLFEPAEFHYDTR